MVRISLRGIVEQLEDVYPVQGGSPVSLAESPRRLSLTAGHTSCTASSRIGAAASCTSTFAREPNRSSCSAKPAMIRYLRTGPAAATGHADDLRQNEADLGEL
jgi:hypothetical protein